MQNIPIATVATAFDDPVSQETYVFVFFEALYFGDTMEHSLISPMQLRHNGLPVDQTPRQYDPSSNQRSPTDSEMQRYRYIYMTEDSAWDPYSDRFRTAEFPFAHANTATSSNTSARCIYGPSQVTRHCNIEPGLLAKRLGISVFNAELTLNSTTQLALHNLQAPMSQRVRTRLAQLRYPRLACRIYSDTLFSDQKSLLGNT